MFPNIMNIQECSVVDFSAAMESHWDFCVHVCAHKNPNGGFVCTYVHTRCAQKRLNPPNTCGNRVYVGFCVHPGGAFHRPRSHIRDTVRRSGPAAAAKSRQKVAGPRVPPLFRPTQHKTPTQNPSYTRLPHVFGGFSIFCAHLVCTYVHTEIPMGISVCTSVHTEIPLGISVCTNEHTQDPRAPLWEERGPRWDFCVHPGGAELRGNSP